MKEIWLPGLIEKIYQTLERVFNWLSKHLEFRQNTPLRVHFSTLFSVFGYPYETLFFVFDILREGWGRIGRGPFTLTRSISFPPS